MKRIIVTTLFALLLFGIVTTVAIAEDVVLLICQMNLYTSSGYFDVISCTESVGVKTQCPPIDPNKPPDTPGPPCSQTLANFLSSGFKIRDVQKIREEGVIYTLIKSWYWGYY